MKRSFLHKISLGLSILLISVSIAACGNPKSAEMATQAGPEEAFENRDDAGKEAGPTALDGKLTITCLKGGAADTFILVSDNHVTLIDTGLDKKADKLVDFLRLQGITRIDELIITHFDKDHVGGADHVLDNFQVGTVYTTYHSKESDDITNYLASLEKAGLSENTVTEITSYVTDGVSFTIYPPKSSSYTEQESNNSSLVIRVSVGESSMLFAGDAEYARISELLKTDNLQSTILKVPHHGRINANSLALIEYVKPKYAIITSSKSEPEDQEILDILASKGITTYLTREGNVTITMTAGDIKIVQ